MALSREGVAMGRTRNRRTTMQAPAPVVDANAANASSGYFLAGGMGLIGILIPWYFELPLNFDVTDREFNPLIFIPVVFLVIAFYALLKAIRDTLRVRKFGTTTLIAGTAVPGGRFEGAVRSSRDLTPNGDYTVQLKCIRTYRVGGPVREYQRNAKIDLQGRAQMARNDRRAEYIGPLERRYSLRLPDSTGRATLERPTDLRTGPWQCSMDTDRQRTDAGAELLCCLRN